MARECAACGEDLNRSDYTKSQWAKGKGWSRCYTCVHGPADNASDASDDDNGDGDDYGASEHSDVSVGYDTCSGIDTSDESGDEDSERPERFTSSLDDSDIRVSYTRKRKSAPYYSMDMSEAEYCEDDVWAYTGDGYVEINSRLWQGEWGSQELNIQHYIECNDDGDVPDLVGNKIPYAFQDTDDHYVTYRRSAYDHDELWSLHNKIVYPMHFLSTTRSTKKISDGTFTGDFFIFKLRPDCQDTWRSVVDMSPFDDEYEVLVGLNAKFRARLSETKHHGLRVYLIQQAS